MTAKPKNSIDFVSEIKKAWHLNETKVKLKFVPDNSSYAITIPKRGLFRGVRLEIRADPSHSYDIIWHEGAHVHLHCVGYPAIALRVKSQYVHTFLKYVSDLVDEYYADKLELEKKGKTTSEKITQLWTQFDTALKCQADLLGVEVSAIQSAIAVRLLEDYDNNLAAKANQQISQGWDTFQRKTAAALAIIRQTPPIPPTPSSKFTKSEVALIRQLVKESCETVYDGTCTLEEI
jgi:hypothetical protein